MITLKKISKYYLVRRTLKNQEGFSLLEIIVAVAIASIILTLTSLSYKTILNAIIDFSGHAEFYENINLALTKIDRDLANTYYNRDNKEICFIGEMVEENSVLNFVTISHRKFNILGRIDLASPRSDIGEIGYYLKEDPEATEVKLLMKREEKHFDDEPEAGGEENLLLENVISLKFQFKSGNDWSNVWDSNNKNRLPEAVKTTLIVKNYNGHEENFIFTSYLNMQR